MSLGRFLWCYVDLVSGATWKSYVRVEKLMLGCCHVEMLLEEVWPGGNLGVA